MTLVAIWLWLLALGALYSKGVGEAGARATMWVEPGTTEAGAVAEIRTVCDWIGSVGY